jgi:pilus assembly protein CpaF
MSISNTNGDSPEQSRSTPQFLGGRQVTLAALRERIEDEFIAETSTRPDILLEAKDEAARRDLIREVADYVLATDGLNLTRPERSLVLDAVYRDLFSFGPLDTYLADDTITELTIDGPEHVFVRRGVAEKMTAVDAYFDDVGHLMRVIHRILLTAGAQLSDTDPFVEIGTVLAGRPARLTVAAPPVSPVLNVEVRLHPVQPATLESLVTAGMLDEPAATLLRAILSADHGLMIAGDSGAGKTTLLSALLSHIPSGAATTIVVERAAELRIPDQVERLAVIWPAPAQHPADFAQQILAALEKHPDWLILDEVRFDETQAIWQALTGDPPANGARPRCLWAFRGTTNPVRLRAAFSMSVRRAQPGIAQEFIHSALLDRLPFVALLDRRDDKLRVISIGEWQTDAQQPDILNLVTIWPSGAIPIHNVDWKLT